MYGHGPPQVPAILTVGSLQSVLHLAYLPRSQSRPPDSARMLQVVGMKDFGPSPILCLLQCQAGIVVPALVVVIHATIGAGCPGNMGNGIRHLPETALAFPEHFFHPLALGNIPVEDIDAVCRRIHINFQPDIIRPSQIAVFKMRFRALRHPTAIGLLDRRAD